MEPSPEDIQRILKSKSCRDDCIFPVKTILFPLQLWKLFPQSRCGCSGPFWVESCTLDLRFILTESHVAAICFYIFSIKKIFWVFDCDIRSLTMDCWSTWTRLMGVRKQNQWCVRGVGEYSVRSGDISPTCILQRSVSMSTSAESVDRKFLPLHTWVMAMGILLGTKKKRRKKQPRRTEVERGQDLRLKNILTRSTMTENAGSARWRWNLKCQKNIFVFEHVFFSLCSYYT